MRAPDWILDAIEAGYRPLRHSRVAPAWMENNQSAMKEKEFVAESLKAMLQGKHLAYWDTEAWGIPNLVIPLSVAISGAERKKRLIFDCRMFNMS
eukprot:gene12208-4727_t